MRTHRTKPLFKCHLCGYAATKRSHLTTHMKIHSGIIPSQWSTTQSSDYYNTTIPSHNTNTPSHDSDNTATPSHDYDKTNSANPDYDKTYSASPNYDNTTTLNSGYDNTATSNPGLNNDVNIHSLEKSYKCFICDYTTTRLNDFSIHMKTHIK